MRLLLALVCILGLALPPAARAAPPAVVPVQVAMQVDNIHGFSPRDKTYQVEGTLQVGATAAVMERWLRAGLDPISLVRFENRVEPWNSLVEPIGGPRRQGDDLSREYRFNARFYSDEIDFRGYPFGSLPLRLNLVANPSVASAIQPPAAIRLVALSSGSGVGRRGNMNGYRLARWSLHDTAGGVDMELVYAPIGWAPLVKWLLPLAITMSVMLLTPTLRPSFGSERLAIPPVVLLTLVFMQQAYRDTLPTLPYLTVLDGLYGFSYLVTLLFFCAFIRCANRLDQRSGPDGSRLERRVKRLEVGLQLASLGGYAVLLAWARAFR